MGELIEILLNYELGQNAHDWGVIGVLIAAYLATIRKKKKDGN